jgi:uncharacterized phiE125 gp8 family phage protein
MDSIVVSTAPSEEPVTLAEARDHMVMDDDLTDDNALITEFIVGARERIEEFTNRAIVTQTLKKHLDKWPYNPRFDGHPSTIILDRPPIQSVTSVQYVDTDGNTQTFDSSKWVADVDAEPGRLYPAYNEVWPQVRNQPKAITITYVAGYGVPSVDDDAVPVRIKRAIYLTVNTWYEYREEVALGTIVSNLPDDVKRVLSSLRIRNVG